MIFGTLAQALSVMRDRPIFIGRESFCVVDRDRKGG